MSDTEFKDIRIVSRSEAEPPDPRNPDWGVCEFILSAMPPADWKWAFNQRIRLHPAGGMHVEWPDISAPPVLSVAFTLDFGEEHAAYILGQVISEANDLYRSRHHPH